MIDYLEGFLKGKLPTSCLIEVNGIGFKVNIPISTFEKLGHPGSQLKILTSLYIRENLWEIYGFATLKERELFNLLISISGIGPRLALAVLSSLSLEDMVRIVDGQDASSLMFIPGVGRKIAQRLIFELRERIQNLYSLIEDKAGIKGSETSRSSLEKDAIQALVSLGYKRAAAQKAVESLKHQSIDSLDLLIRETLKKI